MLALHDAAWDGDAGRVAELLNADIARVTLGKKARDGRSALGAAAMRRQSGVVRLLLAAGAFKVKFN